MINWVDRVIRLVGLFFLWLSLDAAASNCLVQSAGLGQEATLRLHLSTDCTTQEREARALDAAQLLQALKEGKAVDLSGVVIRGDLSLEMLPIKRLPQELEAIKELQRREVRLILGPLTIIDSVVHGAIKHQSNQGLLVIKGPVILSGTRFEKVVDLSQTVFIEPVTLSGAIFLGESYFVQTRFLRDVFAEKTAFGPHTRFHRAVFQGPSTFQQSGFNGLAEFLEVRFEKDINLSRTFFKMGVGFSGSHFKGLADFSEALFAREAFFTFTLFDGDVYFRRAIFRSIVDFSDARFNQRDDFSKVLFEHPPQFTGVVRAVHGKMPPGLESQTIQYIIILSLLIFSALLIAYLIRSR